MYIQKNKDKEPNFKLIRDSINENNACVKFIIVYNKQPETFY